MLKEQDGFTLPEMMVTIAIMIVVLFALYNIFDMSIRVFSFGNDKVESVENARLGLEKMEREVRAAYPVNGPNSTGALRYRFFNANGNTNVPPDPAPPAAMPTASQITFGNELGSSGDGAIRCGATGACEYITYKLTSTDTPSDTCTAANAPCTLRRVNAASSSGTGAPVVDFVRPPVSGDPSRYGLRFRYFTAGGAVIDPAIPGSYTQADIARVEIGLQIEVDRNPNDGQPGRTQNLTTEVNLRNPGVLP